MRFHHIGIAVKDLESAVDFLRKLNESGGFDVEIMGNVHDELQNVELYFVHLGGILLELVSGVKVKSLIDKNIGLYHICYEVVDIESAIEEFMEKGCIAVDLPKPAKAFGGRRVAFLMTPLNFMIELLEAQK